MNLQLARYGPSATNSKARERGPRHPQRRRHREHALVLAMLPRIIARRMGNADPG
jgi:hypothetical protein